MSTNPFAPPSEDAPPASGRSGEGPWRDGEILVVKSGTTLPERCPRCNAAAHGKPVKLPLQWHPRWIWLLAFLGILPLLIVMLFTRRQGVVHVHLCEDHVTRRKIGQIGIGVSLIGLFLGILVGMFSDSPGWFLAGMVCFVLLIAFLLVFRTLWPRRIDGDVLRLKGADPAFLAGLEPWRG
jgi:hypothetical protein